jgi:4-aminobutyrate aminotransferase/(S)-3-amino-2-methylpropionate transaminase
MQPPVRSAIEEAIRFATSGDIAAFIAEPVMGEGGIIVPPRNYFKEVKKVLDRARDPVHRG